MTYTPNQNKYKEIKTFSGAVNQYLKQKKMTQADLISKSRLPRTTISRICRDSNDKGSCYQPTDRVVMSVCVALELNQEETKEMFCLAFPYLPYWDEIIIQKMNLDQANDYLYDQGLPLLGYITEE